MDTSSKLQELLHQKKTAKMEAGKQFLSENAKRAEVQQTASGLQYEILQAGTGNKPGPTTMVTVHYEGKLIDGTVFDSSFKRNQPATFGLHQVIPGWTEGVQLMNEGATFRFYIPYELGYGARGAGGAIPPYSTLIFDVQLIKVS
jgi:FKBP-type peptidyl-prolyl cis-trans isomerase FklB